MKTIAIDPGKSSTGIAIFDRSGLLEIALAEPRKRAEEFLMDLQIKGRVCLVIEVPEEQKGRGASMRSILDLAKTAGRFVGIARARGWEVAEITPNQWKGSVPKEITKDRALKLLEVSELDALRGSKHDMWDAVGIGLYHLHRAARGLI